MAVAHHFGPCSALLSESLPQTQVGAVPSLAVCVSKAEVYQLLVWLPHAPFYFLLYFSSLFYLNCVTVSKSLCFTLHNLFTYSYYLFFPVCLPGITQTRFLRLRRARDAAGGGGPRLAVPPGPRFKLPSQTLFLSTYGATEFKRLSPKGSLHNSQIFLMIVSLSSPLCSQFSICFFRYSYRHCSQSSNCFFDSSA
jgi:hypothetical protein